MCLLPQRVSNHSSEQATFQLSLGFLCLSLTTSSVPPFCSLGRFAVLSDPVSETVWVFHVLLDGAVELLEKLERSVEVENKRWDKCSGLFMFSYHEKEELAEENHQFIDSLNRV